MWHRLNGLAYLLLTIGLLAGVGSVQGQQATGAQPIRLRVLLPAANAELLVDTVPTRQKGPIRKFACAPVKPGVDYSYTLTTTWQPYSQTTITRTKVVSVRAGSEIEVDLRVPDEKKKDDIVVRYVPTPPEVVTAMLKLGEVTKQDIVYDLGCGDGRIVIAAVKQRGAKRGVGVDIDPERVAESKANAKKAGVKDRVDIHQGDVLKIDDLSDASVVMLYLGNDLNMRLRPVLQSTLKPGSRIVSHQFKMGDWKPLKTETVTDRSGERYQVHMWKIGEEADK